ncbi:transporter [Niabella ginsenosidivorans]|uniref:Transporter n=1 Tax=Niabella ginsenosidivorans TaxID=1176587 RepID=A0A1A9I1Q3_9BACT|nr:TolC family protein [Niabella ginsenosidivorans]ANH81453.1 transporter [Niabella ginsenosidivorans]
MKRFFVILGCIGISMGIRAQQTTYTLEQCIDIALKNNLLVSQAENQAGRDEISRKQARLNMLPNLNASVNHGWFFGRSIDNTTNSYVDNNFYSGSYNIGGDVALFRGGYLQNTARQLSMNAQASKMSWQQQKDNITLNTILAYLQFMNAQDLLTQSISQATLSEKQVKRLTVMDSSGAIKPSDLFDLQGQYANDEASIINAKRDVENSKIAICQNMNIPYDSSIVFERIAVPDLFEKVATDANTAYHSALERFSQVKVAEFSLKSAEYGLKAARSQLYPSLSMGYGLGSNYAQSGGRLTDQLKNNSNKNIGLTLSIPIFNNLQARNNVKTAKLFLKDAQQNDQATKTELQQNIQTAYINMTAAYDRYKKLLERVTALQQSYQAAEARFNVGVWNSVEYLTVKTNLDRANIDLIGGRYEYLLRVKIYNYYQGISPEEMKH